MNNSEYELEAEFEVSNQNAEEYSHITSIQQNEYNDIAEIKKEDILKKIIAKSKKKFWQEASNAEDKLNESSNVHVFYPVEMTYKDDKFKSAILHEAKATDDPFKIEKYSEAGITNGYIKTVVFYSKNEALEFIKNTMERIKNLNTVSDGSNNINDPDTQTISNDDNTTSVSLPTETEITGPKNEEAVSETKDNVTTEQNNNNIKNQPEREKKSYSLGKFKTYGMIIVAVLLLWYCGVFDFMSFSTKKEAAQPPVNNKIAGAEMPEEQREEAKKAKEEQNGILTQVTNLLDDNKTDENKNVLAQSRNGLLPTTQNNGQNISQNGNQGQLTPESGGTDVSQDPIYQQRMAMRQAYLELAKQAFISKPTVEGGNWGQQNCASAQQQQKQDTSSSNNPFVQLDNAIQKAKLDAATAAQRAIEGAAGSAAGSNNSDIASSVAAAAGNAAQLSNKEAFFNSRSSGRGYLGNTRTEKISPYTLPSGSMIPCALISGINSDLPGNITASVTENVYDWSNAHVCVIPQGTRIFGSYNSAISWGQKRVQVSWQRLIFPDGSTLDLGGMPGVDRRGFTGVKDKYYGHYGKMAIAALLTTGFTILPAIVEGHFRNDGVNVNYGYGTSAYQTAASAAAQQIGSMGNRFFNKSLNQQPTVLVRPGTRFNIQVNADIPFYKAWSIARTQRR